MFGCSVVGKVYLQITWKAFIQRYWVVALISLPHALVYISRGFHTVSGRLPLLPRTKPTYTYLVITPVTFDFV